MGMPSKRPIPTSSIRSLPTIGQYLGQTGEILTKQSFLSDLKSGKYKLESFQIGPMYVKVLGNVAVVQGSVSETSIADGKENSHKSVWMDVFEKRGDKWMVVPSQTARTK
jgi:hypothetical protein